MSIPTNLTRENLLQAISKIDAEGIPNDGNSRYYDVIYSGKKYPPKLLISYANLFANGEILDRNSFEGGLNTPCFRILEKNGFIIEEKPNDTSSIWIEKSIVKGRDDRQNGDRALGKALWSTQRGRGGADIYKNMRLVKKGDYILHLIDDGDISGVSIANDSVIETSGLDGTNWEGPGYLVKLDNFTELDPIISRADLLNERNKSILLDCSRNSEVFYNKDLNLRQGAYLTPCNPDLLRLISDIYLKLSGKSLPLIKPENTQKQDLKPFLIKTASMKLLNYFLSIKTKPFIILAGLSGTGKSRLVRTLAYQFNNIENDISSQKHPPTNFQLIKVKPNWHDSSELLGYESRISGKDRFIVTDFIRFIAKAWQHPNTPFFLCLDEMNLAPVEQYFAEYLSVIESRRQNTNGDIKTDCLLSSSLICKYANKLSFIDDACNLWSDLGVSKLLLQDEIKLNGLGLPPNLVVMGTVNMDETTHSFSRKVLDRAMTIEMNDINLNEGLDEHNEDWSYPQSPLRSELIFSEKTQGSEVFRRLGKNGSEIITYLNSLNVFLDGSPFKIAYRVRDEFLLYAYNYSILVEKSEDWLSLVMDDMTLMKVLPRIEGDFERTKLLDDLKTLFQTKFLQRSLKKTIEMINKRDLTHYTSFWS